MGIVRGREIEAVHQFQRARVNGANLLEKRPTFQEEAQPLLGLFEGELAALHPLG